MGASLNQGRGVSCSPALQERVYGLLVSRPVEVAVRQEVLAVLLGAP